MKSFNDKKSVYKSQDESSHGGNSSERIIDPSEEEFYESILYTKRDDRSIS